MWQVLKSPNSGSLFGSHNLFSELLLGNIIKDVTIPCASYFLSQEANTSLMRSCWNELFILGLAQCAHVMNLSTILTAIINHLQSSIQDGMEPYLY